MGRQAVATVAALYRFPVKSMGGESLDRAQVYWHGLLGDRRQAFVKRGDLSAFPWLTARDLPELVHYQAYLADPTNDRHSPVLVRTPEGDEYAIESEELRALLERKHGAPIHLMRSGRGAQDAASVSVVGMGSIRALGERIGQTLDVRRFRQNIYLETVGGEPDVEDSWIGRLLVFGDGENAPRIRMVRPDGRCMMVNLSPEHEGQNPAVLREIATSRNNCFGIYASVEGTGTLQVGAQVYLE